MSLFALWLTGHGLRFKTKVEKRRAEEDDKKAGMVEEMKRNGMSPRPQSETNTEHQKCCVDLL